MARRPRIVSWFSCGAASAVATKMALTAERRPHNAAEIVIAYCEVKEEHPDNRRFLRDCEAWFGQPIVILGNDDFDRSTDVVFDRTRFLTGPTGTRCSAELKRSVRLEFQRPSDIVVIGYTIDEYDRRAPRLFKSEPMTRFWFPLVEKAVTKSTALALLERAGIELPVMYRLGYRNNNCIGCVKGQAGYWNKIRRDFPDRFAEMARIERDLGRTICKREWTENGERKLERLFLDELPPDLGKYETEPDIRCGVICQSIDLPETAP